MLRPQSGGEKGKVAQTGRESERWKMEIWEGVREGF